MTRGVRTAWCVGAILGGSNALVHADQLGSTPAGLAAVVGERTVSLAELDALAADQLAKIRADEYAVRRRALDERVNRLLLEQEAARRGESLAEFLRTQVEAQVEPVTDEQARAVHEASPARAPGPPTTEDIARIAATLRQGRLAESRRRVVERLRQSARVRVLIEPPRVAIDTESGPSQGPRDAPVTIVAFSDFQCPFCRAATETLHRVEAAYRGRVRLVFRDFPLANHADAPKAAEAARCAGDQGEFWRMHDALFASHGLQVADLKRRAADIGLDTARFNDCLDSGRHAAGWQLDRALGQRLGVSATPTFFINGRMVAGALPFESFRDVVSDELERRKALP